MTKSMNPVVHFEMPAEDKGRMRAFYESAFDWQTHELGAEMGGYVTVTTTETDENRMVTRPGTINGGFYQKTDDPLGQHPSVVISVDDLNARIAKVKAAGGRILGDIQEIPGIGRFASFIDTEGNRVSMLQPINS